MLKDFKPILAGTLKTTLEQVCTRLQVELPSTMSNFEGLKAKVKAFADNALGSNDISTVNTAIAVVTKFQEVYEKAQSQEKTYSDSLSDKVKILKGLTEGL